MEYKLTIPEGLTYDDVLLVPQFSTIRTRRDVELQSVLTEYHPTIKTFKLPIIASPMDTISGPRMAIAMAQYGGLAILHRYNSIEEQVKMATAVLEADAMAAAAIGVSQDYLERATALYEVGVKILCVDVAHGHHLLVKDALESFRDTFGNDVHLMAGNVATKEGYNDLVDWGADSVRCNIGGGSICSTRVQTGHGVPGLQTILDCAQADRDIPIIADGGIRSSGDIVKALAAGADFVMLGSLLAGTDETPGDVKFTPAGKFKSYRGMASRDAQVEWRGASASLEGVATTLPCKGPVVNVLADLVRGIRSGLSYSGARSIKELQKKAKFVRQTCASRIESSPHILKS